MHFQYKKKGVPKEERNALVVQESANQAVNVVVQLPQQSPHDITESSLNAVVQRFDDGGYEVRVYRVAGATGQSSPSVRSVCCPFPR